MKIFPSLKVLTALVVSATFTALALAHEDQDTKPGPESGSLLKAESAGVPAAWLAKAKADYPMDTCSVSGDKFDGGDMGPPQDYVYRQEGKPDRLIRFCCPHCVRDFKKDPAKYLKMIDDAAAAKTKTTPSK